MCVEEVARPTQGSLSHGHGSSVRRAARRLEGQGPPPGARGLVGLPNFWRNGRLAENRLSDLASLHSQHQNLDTHHGIDLGGSLF